MNEISEAPPAHEATDGIEQAADRSLRGRRLFLIGGTMLWVLATVSLVFVWQKSRKQLGDEAVLSPIANQASIDAPGSGSGVIASEPGKPAANGESPGAAEPTPEAIWDPDGIEDFTLIERNGKEITKADLLGKPWAVCFVFTRCAGPCLQITGQMKKLEGWLKDVDVRLVSITVDPDYDTPEILQNYARAFNADPERWLFLTGEKEKIYPMIINSFKMPVKEMVGEDRKPGWEVLHSTNILHVDATGRVVGKYDGRKDANVVSLRRALEAEAAKRSVGFQPASDSDDRSRSVGFQPASDSGDNSGGAGAESVTDRLEAYPTTLDRLKAYPTLTGATPEGR